MPNKKGTVIIITINSKDTDKENFYLSELKLKPDNFVMWADLGVLYHNKIKDYIKAEEAYRMALKYNPEYARVWGNLGVLFEVVQKDYDRAEEAYRTALKYNPE